MGARLSLFVCFFLLLYRSVTLLMQVSLPCALFAKGPSELCLKGGTNAEMAPQIDYTLKVRASPPSLSRSISRSQLQSAD